MMELVIAFGQLASTGLAAIAVLLFAFGPYIVADDLYFRLAPPRAWNSDMRVIFRLALGALGALVAIGIAVKAGLT